MPPPPTPFHVLRNHAHPIHDVYLSPTAPLLYAGDEDGHVSVTDLTLRRVVAFWKAHDGGVLGVGEWEGRLVSHGRDNLIHIHERVQLASAPSAASGASATLTPLLTPPVVRSSLDVNALNFCRFSIADWPVEGKGKGRAREDEDSAFIAVPNLTDSESVDIYALPSLTRVHAAIGHNPKSAQPAAADAASTTPRSALIMALHVYFSLQGELQLVVAYEDGRVELWGCEASGGGSELDDDRDPEPVWQRHTDARLSGAPGAADQGARWHRVWRDKVHNEAVMAMAVSPANDYAFSVSADHQLVRYALDRESAVSDANGGAGGVAGAGPSPNARLKVASTKQIGNSSVAVMPDGRVVAVGGWDGNVCLFSTRSLKPLGTLPYHRQSVDAIGFASPVWRDVGDDGVEATDDSAPGALVGTPVVTSAALQRWMVTGSKDRRVALWELKDFAQK